MLPVTLIVRRGPDEIKPVKRKRESIRLVERIPAVPRLWLDVHAGYVEPGSLQALARTTSTAEKIKGAGFIHLRLFSRTNANLGMVLLIHAR